MSNKFNDKVYQVLQKVPHGYVTTYGDIATLLGNKNKARAVGNALHKNTMPVVIPCHRVLNAKGELALNFGFGGREGQKKLLEAEGVVIDDNKVSLDKYKIDILKEEL